MLYLALIILLLLSGHELDAIIKLSTSHLFHYYLLSLLSTFIYLYNYLLFNIYHYYQHQLGLFVL